MEMEMEFHFRKAVFEPRPYRRRKNGNGFGTYCRLVLVQSASSALVPCRQQQKRKLPAALYLSLRTRFVSVDPSCRREFVSVEFCSCFPGHCVHHATPARHNCKAIAKISSASWNLNRRLTSGNALVWTDSAGEEGSAVHALHSAR